jgi:hypothetical protein
MQRVGWVGAGVKYFYGHVLIAVRQGRQRRDAAAAGEEQIGRCAEGRLLLQSLVVGDKI